MSERENEDIRRLLAGAVPPLPAPADRLAEVGARVRRQRRRAVAWTGAAAAAAVALAVGVPALALDRARTGPPAAAPTPAPTPTDDTPAGRCPKPGPPRGSVPTADKPGPLVPTGATKITLCQARPNGRPAGGVVWVGAPARALSRDAAAVVAALNGLPDRTGLTNVPPDATLGCRAPLLDHYTLLLAYPGRTVTVDLDLACGTATSGGRTRFRPDPVITTFIDRYRAQRVAQTDPASVPAPECPAAAALVTTPEQGPPDEISPNRGSAVLTLPEPVVALAACRYAVSGDAHMLERRVTARYGDGVLGRLRDAVNRETSHAREGIRPRCGDPATAPRPVLDVAVLVDASGAKAQVRAQRGPCQVDVWLVDDGAGVVPVETVALLDELLGRVT